MATRQLTGSIFSETVILIIEYGAGGAMGLIINRPTKAPISKLFPEVKELKNRQDPAFLGGPVEMYKAFLLLASRSKNPPGKSLRIFNQIYISADMNALKAAAKDPASRFRIYAGYAGWTSGQLESEINRGDWYILSADEKTLFDLPASEIWPELIGKSGIEAMNATGLLRLAYRLR
ncbi:MAG: YqgE/AlgH family protein [Nitrospiraceae bacterium]|nr:YqgE/AlgH family protein [Nitrospiraceae bacterium]